MTQHYEYTPQGVCSRKMVFELDGDTIVSLDVQGGCNGNLKGLSAMLRGQKISDVIERLRGIECGVRPTSCPDQISKALLSFQNQN